MCIRIYTYHSSFAGLLNVYKNLHISLHVYKNLHISLQLCWPLEFTHITPVILIRYLLRYLLFSIVKVLVMVLVKVLVVLNC